MTPILQLVQTAPGLVVYLVVAAIVFAESAAPVGLVLPGETALLAVSNCW